MSGGPYGRGKAPERECMKLQDWPAPDRNAWRAALAPGDVFEDGGARAGLRSTTNAKVEKGYGRWITFLSLTEPECLADPPGSRLTPERVRRYVEHLQGLGNSTQTQLSRLQEIGDMSTVLDPARDWGFIAALAARIRARHKPARDKDARMVAAEELLALGLALMQEAHAATTARRRASQYRDGLLIGLLALVPLRRRNIAALELERTLVNTDGVWRIVIPAGETKTHEAEDRLFPSVLVQGLEDYLAVHRPYLAGLAGRWHKPAGNALWVSTDGSPMTEMALYDRIRLGAHERLGVALYPHIVRDIAATTLAIEDPEHIFAAAPVLGHRDFQTTQRHYLRARRHQAHKEFVEVMGKRGGAERTRSDWCSRGCVRFAPQADD